MKFLFGPDGHPIALSGTAAEQQEMLTKAILIECFGAIAGLQQRVEWPSLPGGIDEGATRLLDAIIDRVGREPLVERFKAYGVRFETPEDAAAPPTEPRAPIEEGPNPTYEDVQRSTTAELDGKVRGHSNPANPYRKVLGWPTKES